MFTLYKIVGAFAAPPGLFIALLLLLALVIFFVYRDRSLHAKLFAALAHGFALILYFISIPAGAHLVTGSLETRYSVQLPPDDAPAALVLAGGFPSMKARLRSAFALLS